MNKWILIGSFALFGGVAGAQSAGSMNNPPSSVPNDTTAPQPPAGSQDKEMKTKQQPPSKNREDTDRSLGNTNDIHNPSGTPAPSDSNKR
jgi:hypothetical protein